MTQDTAAARRDALSFLKNHKVGVLASVSAEGKPQASTVFYVTDDNFNIYILTLVNTRKYKAIDAHPEVAFTVYTPQVPQTLQLEGMATDLMNDPEAPKKKDELFAALNSNPWFYAPITKLDPAESAIIWIRPTWVRWADYAFAPQGSDQVFKQIL